MRSVLRVAVTIVIVVACGPPKAHETATMPGANSAIQLTQLDDCGCPKLPPVATGETPAPGTVKDALTITDLESIISNRDAVYGSWDIGLRALSRDIDPDGRYGIYDGTPIPAPTSDTPLREGWLSEQLVHPFATRERGKPAGISGFRSPSTLSHALLDTIARADKYGEPEAGVRDAAIRVARFLIDRVTAVGPRADDKGRAISAFGLGMRTWLRGTIAVAAMGPRPELDMNAPGDLQLDVLDKANAALEILWSKDAQGREHGTFSVRPSDGGEFDRYFVTDALLLMSSAQAAFGGRAPPRSRWDAVACRAYTTLLRLASADVRGAEARRHEIYANWFNLSVADNPYAFFGSVPGTRPPNRAAYLAVARSAVTKSGFGSVPEAQGMASALFSVMEHAAYYAADRTRDPYPELDDVVDFSKALERPSSSPGDAYRSAYTDAIEQSMVQVKAAADADRAVWEKTLSDTWSRSFVATSSIAKTPACGANRGVCSLESAAAPEPVFTATPELVLKMPDQSVDQNVEYLDVSQPLVVEVKVPADSAAMSSVEVTARQQRTGKSETFTLTKAHMEPGFKVFEDDVSFQYRGKWLGGASQYHVFGIRPSDGDRITFSYGDRTAILKAYKSWVQAELAATDDEFALLYAYYKALASGGEGDADAALAKMRVIDNARKVLAHQPEGYEHFNDVTRVEIARGYADLLETDPAQWHRGWAADRLDPPREIRAHFDGRSLYEQLFGITFVAYEEQLLIKDALASSRRYTMEQLNHVAGRFAYGMYYGTVMAAGVNDYMIAFTCTDAYGHDYRNYYTGDCTERVNAGLRIARDYVVNKTIGIAFTAAQELWYGERALWSTVEAQSQSELFAANHALAIERAPGEPLERYLHGAAGSQRAAKSVVDDIVWAGEYEVLKKPLDGVPTYAQRYANTCALAGVVQPALRKVVPKWALVRMPWIERYIKDEKLLANVAYNSHYYSPAVQAEASFFDAGTAVRVPGSKLPGDVSTSHVNVVGGGMNSEGVAELLNHFGLETAIVKRTNRQQIQAWLQKGYAVGILVKPGNQAGRHWVNIEGFQTLRSGNLGVAIGEPWPGKSIAIEENAFCRQIFREANGDMRIVVGRWPPKAAP